LSRIGFITLYAPGHLNPSLALARALQKHGHEIVYFNLLDTGPTITAAGVRFVAFGQSEFPEGALRQIMQKTAELFGPAAFGYYVERMVNLFRCSFQYLPELIQKEHVDLLIIDQVHYAGATLAQHLNLPFVSLANALLVNREAVIPPPITLWPYDTSVSAIERNLKGWAGVDTAYAPLLSVINEQRYIWHLSEYVNLLEDSFSPVAQIAQQPAFFDFPRPESPANLHLVGHLHDERFSSDIEFPWEWLDGRPLIYASCGTIQNRLEHIFRAIIDACAPLDAQTIISLGRDALSPEIFEEVPANIKLVRYAPQRKLLGRAHLCIHHAGLNTALDCLEAGVPAVAIPIASEQPGIAMRLARLDMAIVLPLSEMNANTLSAAIRKALGDPRYRTATQVAAVHSRALHPLMDAVRIIEQTLASIHTAI
jgi:zeaxanthin glucosyltransferase